MIHVAIMCQGQQKRLAELGPKRKQMLELPACDGTPILDRTLEMLLHWARAQGAKMQIRIVAWPDTCSYVSEFFGGPWSADTDDVTIGAYSFEKPGNSSLVGVAQHLQIMGRCQALPAEPIADRTVILLGDVIYSHRVLNALLMLGSHTVGPNFFGTKDLSPGGGEIFGVAWGRSHHDFTMRALARALARQPFGLSSEYQPGQLRTWFWEIEGEASRKHLMENPCGSAFFVQTATDDYIDDIDKPEDLGHLGLLSERAFLDDKVHGLLW